MVEGQVRDRKVRDGTGSSTLLFLVFETYTLTQCSVQSSNVIYQYVLYVTLEIGANFGPKSFSLGLVYLS